METTTKQVKALIGSMLTNDQERISKLVAELNESVIPDKESQIMEILTESFRGDTNV